MTVSTLHTQDPSYISADTFWNHYQPQVNPNSQATSVNEQVHFYPGSDDMAHVRKAASENRVWTWITCDDGSEIIIAGYWSTDALMHFVTAQPWEDDSLWTDYSF